MFLSVDAGADTVGESATPRPLSISLPRSAPATPYRARLIPCYCKNLAKETACLSEREIYSLHVVEMWTRSSSKLCQADSWSHLSSEALSRTAGLRCVLALVHTLFSCWLDVVCGKSEHFYLQSSVPRAWFPPKEPQVLCSSAPSFSS